MSAPEEDPNDTVSSLALSDALSDCESPRSAAFAPGYSPELGCLDAVPGVQFQLLADDSPLAESDMRRLDP